MQRLTVSVEDDVDSILVQEGLVDDPKALHLLEAAGVAAVPGAATQENSRSTEYIMVIPLINNNHITIFYFIQLQQGPTFSRKLPRTDTAGRFGMSSCER